MLRPERKTLRRVPALASSAGLVLAVGIWLVACGGTTGVIPPSGTPPGLAASLTQSEVDLLVQAAAKAIDSNTMAIAVVDRAGRILAVYSKVLTPPMVTGDFGQLVPATELAASLARTAAFFSNDQAPLSSRTVRFISGIHFPLGVSFVPNADLYGIENTNRGCALSNNFIPGQEVPRSGLINGTFPGLGIATGKADVNDSDQNAVNAGGVPLFRNGRVIGGIGVAGVLNDVKGNNVAEFAAFTAATTAVNGISALPSSPLPPPGAVVIAGIALPFVDQTTRPSGVGTGSFSASNYVVGPVASSGPPPEGDLVAPTAGAVGGLTAAEVRQIIDNAIATANKTRAAIRLPQGMRTRMVIAVTDLDGTIIGLHRMPDATIFSIDVAATKARNMIYFNSASRTLADLNEVPMGTAVTNRTISFGAQPLYPPGIDGSAAGPFFNLYQRDVANPCSQGFQPAGPNQSGIVFFPGSVPLYKNGKLVGGLGVSGDGVDQDDFVTNGGAMGFEPPAAIRADQIMVRNVRLPYLKFPRNPTD